MEPEHMEKLLFAVKARIISKYPSNSGLQVKMFASYPLLGYQNRASSHIECMSYPDAMKLKMQS
jgi:hypothetical protein